MKKQANDTLPMKKHASLARAGCPDAEAIHDAAIARLKRKVLQNS